MYCHGTHFEFVFFSLGPDEPADCASSGSSTASAGQEFYLGRRKLFIGQHALGVQVGELLQLGRQVILGGCCDLGRRRRILRLLLGLGIGSTLLVGLVILLLGGRILLGILLILVMVYGAGGTSHHCRANRHTSDTSSNHSSSHHIDLFSLL
jgi:hypothetical protein